MTKSREQISIVSNQEKPDELKLISLGDLRVAEWNARKTIDEGALADLMLSIEEHGIQVPLLVRILPISAWKTLSDQEALEKSSATLYEIVAGHRRFEAAQRLDLASVPCLIRDMDDATAREVGLVDNLQREDVPPMEEAEAFGELLDRLGSVLAVAARVGKKVDHVAKQLKLRTLGVPARRALAERLITIDHALLLARLGVADQDAPLKWALDRNAGVKTPVDKVISDRVKVRADKSRRHAWHWEAESVLRLKEHIEQSSGRALKLAPWLLDDAELAPARGACTNCPSNTKVNNFLFGDLNIEEATCADGACFEMKRSVFVKIQLQKAGEDLDVKPAKRIPRLSWKASSVRPKTGFNDVQNQQSMNTCADASKVLKYGQWVEAKKGSCPDVRPGVTVDWFEELYSNKKPRKPGETLLVCIACGCKVHKKEYEKPKRENGNSPQDTAAQKVREEKRKADSIAECKLRLAVISNALAGVKTIPAEALRVIAIAAAPSWGEKMRIAAAAAPGYVKTLETAKVDSQAFAQAIALVSLRNIAVNEYESPESGRKEFLASIKSIGYAGELPWNQPKQIAKKLDKPSPKKAAKPAAKKAAKKKAKR